LISARSDKRLLALAVLLGVFLRLFHLGSQSIWGDEALTLQKYAAGGSLAEVLSLIWRNAFHPPLYFVLAHYWYLLGQSEFMLRFPSAVFGIAAIPVIYLVTRRLFTAPAAGLAALALAVSPFHIWYSQEARMYSLQVLLALGSMLFFLRAWESRRLIDFALYGVLTVMGLFTHLGTLLLVAAQGAFVLGAVAKDWRRYAIWLGVQAMALIAFLPWILRFIEGNRGPIGYQREASLLHLGYGLYTFSVGYSFGPSVSSLHYLPSKQVIAECLPAIAASAVIFGLLVILGFAHAYKANRAGFWFLSSHLFIPLALVGIASLLPNVPLNARYLMVAVVPYVIALALGVRVCLRAGVLRLLPAAAVLLAALSLYNHYFDPAYAKQDMRSAVRLVNMEAKPGDVVIISSIELGGPFIYYFNREDVPYVGYPPRVGLVKPERVAGDLAEILRNKKHAWLILGRTWSSDPHGLILKTLETRYALVKRRAYPGVTVSCFRLPS
jgi:uncharacterized membrane protein